jgi:hypothetical protein
MDYHFYHILAEFIVPVHDFFWASPVAKSPGQVFLVIG